MKRYLYILFVLAVSGYSCKKEHVASIATSNYDYMPAAAGHWVIYDVDSVVHADNDGNTDDSIRYFHFQIKELVESTFIDGEGRPTQRIERYHRNNDSSEWYITNVWTQTIVANRAERVEDNIRYISLGFPINSNITWNRNAFNELGEADFAYPDFHVPYSINSLSFDSTLSIMKADTTGDDNWVERYIYKEKYAVHVGRIYKIYQDLYKNAGQVVSGLDYRETVVAYGN